MKEKNPKQFPNSKIQNLFMCKREIQKLRQKVLGLIEQPCEDFQWCKKKVIIVKNKQQPKKKSKSQSKKLSSACTQNKCLKPSKQVPKKQKKDCACNNFWSQQKKKIEEQKKLSKKTQQKITRNSHTKKKSRHEIRSAQNKIFNDQTPKRKKLLKKLNFKSNNVKPSILVNQSCSIQAPLTVRKSINKNRYLNTESTVDNTDQKKLYSPHSELLYSRTQRVKFQDNDDLAQSFLLSQKSNTNPQQLEFSLKNSMKKSRKSKSSLIRIEKSQQKDIKSSRNPEAKLEDSLNFSSLNSKYWKGSLRKITDSMKSQNFRKFNETNLLQSQKQNDQNFINNFEKKNLQKSDLTTSWTLGNSYGGEKYKKPLNIDMIKKICQKTQIFMNKQIYPFGEVLCAEDDVQNFTDSLKLSKSINTDIFKKQDQKEKIYKLWIDE